MTKPKPWQSMATAPKDGRPIRIKGRRFMSEAIYYATAVWTSRKCPALVQGWFPATDKHDGAGDYGDVIGWREL